MNTDNTPENEAERIVREAMGEHNYELEQYAKMNAHLVGLFWQTLGRYMGIPELEESRLELTRLYAIKIIFGDDSRVEIDA